MIKVIRNNQKSLKIIISEIRIINMELNYLKTLNLILKTLRSTVQSSFSPHGSLTLIDAPLDGNIVLSKHGYDILKQI